VIRFLLNEDIRQIMRNWSIESQLLNYEPEMVDKTGFIEFYSCRQSAAIADIAEIYALQDALKSYQNNASKEPFRRLQTGIAFLLDQYPLSTKARNAINREYKDLAKKGYLSRPKKDFEALENTIGQLMVGLHYLISGIN
jgi:hypothetical protein